MLVKEEKAIYERAVIPTEEKRRTKDIEDNQQFWTGGDNAVQICSQLVA